MQNENKTTKGFLVTFEGIDGSGKSTQIKILEKNLLDRNFKVLLTREPGGTYEGEEIRKILLSEDKKYEWDSLSELLLIMIARREHYLKVLLPAIQNGTIVLCDRFLDSTVAYQCGGNKLSKDIYNNLSSLVLKKFLPDITILLDLPVEESYNRIQKRGILNKFDSYSIDFYQNVRDEYLAIAKKNTRVKLFNALSSKDYLCKEILDVILKKIQNDI